MQTNLKMQASLVCHHRHHHSHNPVDAGRGRRRQLSSSMRSMQSALSAMTRPREVRAGLETQPSWGRVVPKLVFCTSLPSIGVPVRPQVSERSSGPCSNCLTSSMVSLRTTILRSLQQPTDQTLWIPPFSVLDVLIVRLSFLILMKRPVLASCKSTRAR